MPIDQEAIKKAIDDFEDDKFVDAKEKIQKEIRKVKNEFLKKKLDLKKEIDAEKEDSDDGEEKEESDKKE